MPFQLLLKIGLNMVGAFKFEQAKDVLILAVAIIKNPYVVFGTLLMASSYFLWLAILSWFKLSIAFPLTAIGFIFVAILSYFMLSEKLLWYNYVGIGCIAFGIFLLLLNLEKLS